MVRKLTTLNDDISSTSEAALLEGYGQTSEGAAGEAEAAEWVEALLADAACDDD